MGFPLALLWREMKTIKRGLVKLSVKVCAFMVSSLSMSSVTSFLLT